MSEVSQRPACSQLRFNDWLKLGPAPSGNKKKWLVFCCRCGESHERYASTIRSGASKMCIRCTRGGTGWFISEKGRAPVIGVDVPSKKCAKCDGDLQVVLNRATPRGWIYQCPACTCAVQMARYRAPRTRAMMDAHAVRARLKQYGMTPGQAFTLWELQDRCCAICSTKLANPLEKSQASKGTHVDHCHTTGVVRGFLCSPCNNALGLFKENSLLLRKAIRYLNGGNADLVSAVLHGADEGAEHGGVSDANSDANS